MKFTAKYDNPYEAAYNLLKGNQWFRQDDWDIKARRGELDEYIGILSEADRLPSFEKMNNTYRFDLMDTDRRFLAMANELNADRTNIDTEREEIYYDELGNEQTRKFNMSDYEYNKYLLTQYRDLKIAQEEFEREQQRKDEMNGFVKFLATIPATGAEIIIGATDWVNDMANLFEAISDSVTAGFKGESMGDAFREAYTNPDWRFLEGKWIDDIREWEAKKSYLRNLDGSYTGIGQYLGGVAYSLGEALPSMLLNLIGAGVGAKVGGEVGEAIASNVSKAATALYYTGMGSGTARELFNDPRMATVPTYKIILNATVKTAAEYLIQKGVSKAFGSTQLDHLMFGEKLAKITGKTLRTQALQRIMHDVISEGTEELLQEYSNWFVDRFFALDEQVFDEMTNWDFKTMANAFILGGLSVLASSVTKALVVGTYDRVHDMFVKDKVVTYSRSDIDTIKDETIKAQVKEYFNANPDAESGQFVIPANLRTIRVGTKALGPFAAGEYRTTFSEMMQEFQRIQTDSSLTPSQLQDAVSQMYISMRTIASLYGAIGEEQFKQASDLLDRIKEFSEADYSNYITDLDTDTITNIRQDTKSLLTLLNDVSIAYTEDALKKQVEKKLKKAKINDIDQIIHRDDIDSVEDPELREKCKDMFDANPDLNDIAVTVDGITAVFDEEARAAFIPLKYMKATSVNGILKLNAEQTLVTNTLNATYLKHSLDIVADIYKKITNSTEIDMEEMVYNLFFNDVFQDILLHQANSEVYKLVSHLDKIEEDATRKTAKDAIYKERIKNVRSQLAIKIAQYLIFQQRAQYEHLAILTAEQKNYIHNKRWSRDLANRIIDGDILSVDDTNLLKERIKYAPMPEDMKQKTLDSILSDNKVARQSALSTLEAYYENLFNSPYDNKTYLEDTTFENRMFNEFLQLSGLTLKTMFKVDKNSDLYHQIEIDHGQVNRNTVLAYLRNQFKTFTNAALDFTVVKGQIQIHEMTPSQQAGFKNYNVNTKLKTHNNDINNRTFVTPTEEQSKLLSKVLNKDIDAVSRGYISLHDIIFNSETLSKKIKNEIADQYGQVTPLNTFLYLRQYFLTETGGTISVVVTADGNFAFVNIENMINIFSNPEVKMQIDEEVNISKYINGDYLQGRLADIVVKLSDKDQYLPTSNVIEIDRNSNDAEFRFALAHEFQHAVQVENNLNGGLDAEWLIKLPAGQRRTIVKDIREHKSELFKDVKKGSAEEMIIASNFVYDTTGETQAYGAEGSQFVDYYPTVVRTQRGVTTITLPWGARYDINNNQQTMAKSNNELQAEFNAREIFGDTVIDNILSNEDILNVQYYAAKGKKKPIVIFELSADIVSKQRLIKDIQSVFNKDLDIRLLSRTDVTLGDMHNNGYAYVQVNNIQKGVDKYIRDIDISKRLNNHTVSHDISLDTSFKEISVNNNFYNDALKKINDLAKTDLSIGKNIKYGVILPDGSFGKPDIGEHTFFFDKIHAYNGFTANELELYTNSIIEYRDNKKLDTLDDKAVYFTIGQNITFEQKSKLIDFIDELIEKGYTVELGNKSFGTYKGSNVIVSNRDTYFKEGLDLFKRFLYETKTQLPGMSMIKSMDANQRKINDYAKATYHKDMQPNSLTGFIFPDGEVGFSETMWTHEQFYNDLNEKFATGVDQYKDSLVEIALNGRFGYKYVDNMTIRINGDLNVDQKAALYDFVADVLAYDVSLDIEHVPTRRYVTSQSGDYDAGKLLAKLGRVWGNAFGTSSMSMAQPGRSRRITKDTAQETNLKYFYKKRKLLSPTLQDFIANTNRMGLEPEIWAKIGGSEKGTLTETWLLNWFRDADKMNDYTFNKIKQYFFPEQKWIKTFSDLQFVETMLRQYYALRVVLKKIGREDILYKPLSKERVMKYIDQAATDKRTAALFAKISSRFDTYRDNTGTYVDLDIREADHRRAIMKKFDGSVNQGGYLGVVAKGVAIMLDRYPNRKGARGSKNISTNEQTADGLTREDLLADEDAQEAFNETLNAYTRQQMIDMLYEYTLNESTKKGIKFTKRFEEQILQAIESRSNEVLEQMFIQADLANTYDINYDIGIDVNATTEEQAQFDKNVLDTGFVKKSVNYQASIIQNARTIMNNLTPKSFKKLPQNIQDMFEDGKLKPDVYRSKSREELLQLQTFFQELKETVMRGTFDIKGDDELKKEIKRLERLVKRQQKQISTLEDRVIREQLKTVTFDNYDFVFKSDLEMPQVLKDMLGVSFTKFADTNVTYLSDPGEQHVRMNYKAFLDQNALSLNELTQADVDAIVDFYTNSIIDMPDETNESSYIRYNTFKMFILGSLIELSRTGSQFVLSQDQVTRINHTLETMTSTAATLLSTFRTIMPKLNPAKVIVQSMAKANGVEFDEQMVDDMIKAIRSNDIKKAQEIRQQMYDDVLAKAQTRKIRRGVFDKILAFERMAMLSSPGTWMRNIYSNIIVTASNTLGDIIGATFAKIGEKFKKPIEYSVKQYTLTGTKIDQKTYDFVQNKLIDSGLLDLIRDGVSKYDPIRKNSNSQIADRLTKAIMRSIENEVFGTAFDDKIIGNISKFISTMLSDNAFINKRVKAYIAKMLIEDNIDIDNGITQKVEEVIINAYTLASYEYMHKPNAFSRMEQSLRQKSEVAYFAWKQIMPFASASWNWFVEGLSYTPLGLIKGIIDLNRIEKTINKIEDAKQKGENVLSSRFTKFLALRKIGKGVIGSVMFGIGILLGVFGVAQIDDDDDKLKLRVGNMYVDISSLTGMQGVMLGIAVTNPRKGNIEAAIYDVADTLLNDSVLSSFYDAFKYSNNVGDYAVNEAITIANMFVPNALKALSTTIQVNKVRYHSGIIGQLERYATGLIPGLSYAFPTYIDPYTGETQTKYKIPFILDAANRFVLPVKLYDYNMSNIEKQAVELGVHRGELTGNYKDIGKLTPKQKAVLNQKYGELNKKALTDFMNNKTKYSVKNKQGRYQNLTYSQMTDEQRANAIEGIMSKNASYAKIYVYTSEMGGKYYASSNEYNTLKQLGITKNIYRSAAGKEGFAI